MHLVKLFLLMREIILPTMRLSFFQCFNDNHHVLNTDDQDFQHILVDLGPIANIHLLSAEDYGVIWR
jgi:hypothetical protein